MKNIVSSMTDKQLTRRELLEKVRQWSPVIGIVFLSTGSGVATTGCASYSDYTEYSEYCNITYCNGCCQNYSTSATCYCNYNDYSDSCCG